MAGQVLFYEQAAAVSHERHAAWSVETGSSYAFARHTNAVPIMAVEFARAARAYPIVFAGQGEARIPVAVLGLRDKENTFITDEGGWSAEYIPAFVRRYPFIFATSDGGKNFTLCIDESFAGCNQDGRGEPLFGEANKPSPFVDRVLGFLSEYERQYQRTRELTARLGELGLLEPVQASVAFDSGEKLSVNGLSVVSRDRLKALSPENLSRLAKEDLLELCYVHIQSLSNFSSMVERSAGLSGGGAAKPSGLPASTAGKGAEKPSKPVDRSSRPVRPRRSAET